MKPALVSALAGSLLLAACTAPPAVRDHPAQGAKDQRYRCESGQVITAAYPGTDAARVRYQGREYSMGIAISGSGARYTGEGLEWWTKGSGTGSTGMLSRLEADGTSGEIIENCTGE